MDKEGVLEFSKLNKKKKNDPGIIGSDSLREKCLYSKLFSHSHWIWRDTEYLSVFSANAGKCGSE